MSSLRIIIILFFLTISNWLVAQDCDWDQTFILKTDVCNNDRMLKLVFEDNFDSTYLDSTKWENHYPWGRHLVGTSGIAYNTDGDNMAFKDGLLIFTIRKEHLIANVRDYREPGCTEPDIGDCILEDELPNRREFQYTTSMIWSKHRFGYGKFEIRCKIPHVDGNLSAFWLYGWCGDELDVFEFGNSKINTPSSVSSRLIRMANHRLADCSINKGSCSKGSFHRANEDLSNDFHTYSMEHDELQRIWRFDGEIINVFYNYKNALGQDIKDCGDIATGIYLKDPTIHNTKMWITAGAGVKTFCYPLICDRGVFPVQMEIDYIKVWERVPGDNAAIIYPNPNRGTFIISVSDTTENITSVFVLNSIGLPVFKASNINESTYSVALDVDIKGLYFLHVYIGDRLYVKKIILE